MNPSAATAQNHNSQKQRWAVSPKAVHCCPLVAERCVSYLGLEAAEELRQVGVFPGQRQDAFLRHGAVHVVVLQDDVLLQDLDGVDVLRPF